MASLNSPVFARLLLALLAVGVIGQPGRAAPSSAELAVKATFLVKFASYIEWPPSKLSRGGDIIICVLGRDPFGDMLDRAAVGQNSNGHPITARRIASASQAGACHFVYLGGPAGEVPAALAAIAARPIVAVTDARVSGRSGMIHFQLAGGRVRFDIDAIAASRAGVGISSKLLGLARKVRR